MRHDDGREYWTFTAALPPPDLARYVNSYWEVEGAIAHVREKILPTADIVLIFNLGDVQHLVDRDDQSNETAFPNAFVSGLQERFLITASHHRSWLCGMRLSPFGAYKLFRTPLTGVANRVLHLEDLRGSASLRFADTLRNARSPLTRCGNSSPKPLPGIPRPRSASPVCRLWKTTRCGPAKHRWSGPV